MHCGLNIINVPQIRMQPQTIKANDVDYKEMYNVATKQNGYLKAQFEKELEIFQKSDKILRAENIALHERTQLIQGKYTIS